MLDIQIKNDIDYKSMCYKFAQACIKLNVGIKIGLNGDLGVGKTHFFRSICTCLEFNEPVKSPTFTLMENYQIHGKLIYHLDCYRIKTFQDLMTIGYGDIESDAIVFIEWASAVKGLSEEMDVLVSIADRPARSLCFNGTSRLGHELITQLL